MKTITQDIITSLPVMEHFYTLQGEGFRAGIPERREISNAADDGGRGAGEP